MSLCFKVLLTWLLVLALPLQGLAAVGAMHCGPGHQRQAVGVESAGHAAHHALHADHHAALPTDPAASPPRAGKVPPDQHKCNVCAACCTVAVPSTLVLDVPAPLPVATHFGAIVPAVEAFATEGPDRPPRTSLA